MEMALWRPGLCPSLFRHVQRFRVIFGNTSPILLSTKGLHLLHFRL